MHKRTTQYRLTTSLLVMALATVFSTPVAADPPPWAPAHGYRDKHRHRDNENERYQERYPTTGYLVNGSCNRTALGAVLGGVAGGTWAPASAKTAVEMPRR